MSESSFNVCQSGNLSFSEEQQVWRHIALGHSKKKIVQKIFSCRSCNKSFHEKRNLSKHFSLAHSNNNHKSDPVKIENVLNKDILQQPNTTSMVPTSNSSIMKHPQLSTNVKNIVNRDVEERKKVFSKSETKLSELNHQRNVTNPQQTSRNIDIIQKSASNNDIMQRGFILPTSEPKSLKDDVCKICDRKFYDNRSLRRHVAFVHPSNNNQLESSNICTICNKSLAHKWSLRRHLKDVHANRTHEDYLSKESNELPNQISSKPSKESSNETTNNCRKRALAESVLSQDIDRTCSNCHKQFSSVIDLKKHFAICIELTKSPEEVIQTDSPLVENPVNIQKYIKCRICKKTFGGTFNWKRHLKEDHAVKNIDAINKLLTVQQKYSEPKSEKETEMIEMNEMAKGVKTVKTELDKCGKNLSYSTYECQKNAIGHIRNANPDEFQKQHQQKQSQHQTLMGNTLTPQQHQQLLHLKLSSKQHQIHGIKYNNSEQKQQNGSNCILEKNLSNPRYVNNKAPTLNAQTSKGLSTNSSSIVIPPIKNILSQPKQESSDDDIFLINHPNMKSFYGNTLSNYNFESYKLNVLFMKEDNNMVAMSEVKRPSHVFRNLNIKKEKLDHVKTSTPQQLSDNSRLTRLQQQQQQQQQALEEQQQNDATKTLPSVSSSQQQLQKVIPVSNETKKSGIGKKNSFQCNLCNKVVSSADSLKRHVKGVHLKQTARRCDLCQTSFSDAHSLKRHKNSVHKTK
jgi:hypothetical protein